MSSPFYQPDSPSKDYPITEFIRPMYLASFERYEGPSFDNEEDDDLNDEFEEFAQLMKDRKELQDSMATDWRKRKAECEFRFTQEKSHDLEKFFEPNMFMENIPNEFDVFENQEQEVLTNKFNKKVEFYEDLVVASIFVASYEDITNQYSSDKLSFNDGIFDEVKSALVNEDLNFWIRYEKTDVNLFIERNLFQAVQYYHHVDKSFSASHFPMKDGFDKIHIKHFHSADNLKHISLRIQEIAERDKTFKNLFLKDKSFKYFKKLMRKDKYISRFAILMYLLFLKPELIINDRHKKMIEISSDLFKDSKFKFFSISEIFKSVGIFFFEDFCNFRIYKRFIANSVLNSFREYQKRKEKLVKLGKFRKYEDKSDDENLTFNVLNSVRIDLMDSRIGLDDVDYRENEDEILNHKLPNRNEFDYSFLRDKEIRHEIIRFED